jgi:hypothetical protein
MADDDFERLFERFKAMLEPYATRMHQYAEVPGMYGVDMAPEGERDPSTWFAGTRLGKRLLQPLEGGRIAIGRARIADAEGLRGDRRRSSLGRRPACGATRESEVAVAPAPLAGFRIGSGQPPWA